MSRPTLYIHIGPGRTGTTFLQDRVFNSTDDIKFLSYPSAKYGDEQIEFGEVFLISPSIWSEGEPNVFRRMINCGEIEVDKKKVLLSSENIHGGFGFPPEGWIVDPPKGANNYDLRYHDRHDPSSLASHIEKIQDMARETGFSEVKVIFTARRQDTKIASEYAQLSNRVKGASQESFERWVDKLISKPLGYYKSGGVSVDYSLILSSIANILGRESILVLVFEELKEDTEKYLKKIFDFLDMESIEKRVSKLSSIGSKNARSKSKKVWGIRELDRKNITIRGHRFLKYLGANRSISIPRIDLQREDTIRLEKEVSNRILKTFESSNINLNEKIDHANIRKYGYY